MKLVQLMAPELILIAVACVLFLLGVSTKAFARRLAPVLAFASLAFIFAWQLSATANFAGPETDPWGTVTVSAFSNYVKLLVAGVGALLVLLSWPTNRFATGSASIDYGHDCGEFFALLLLSLAGVFLVATANDLILLFLAIELASIPTYIMVSISRPLPVAQEAGVKYFFLGAMAAAVMLFGFSYLYGTTGITKLDQLTKFFDAARGGGLSTVPLNTWQMLAVVMLLAGFAFKLAAVPLHAYAGDVYQGAATPVTALLAFVPKTSGVVAIIKILAVVGGGNWAVPVLVIQLLSYVAAFTMSVGNVLGLLQSNIKRVLAYSSVAHSGYMLVGIAALAAAPRLLGTTDSAGHLVNAGDVAGIQENALGGVLFYLAAYGIMNIGTFGILMLLPSRAAGLTASSKAQAGTQPTPTLTAETFEDLAGTGRKHPMLGLAMAVCCFSLIGLPLTVGFFGKLYLIQPALASKLNWLVVVTMVNAAVSAAYYLRMIATMYLRPAPEPELTVAGTSPVVEWSVGGVWPLWTAVTVSAVGTLLFGSVLPAVNSLTDRTHQATLVPPPAPTVAAIEPPATH